MSTDEQSSNLRLGKLRWILASHPRNQALWVTELGHVAAQNPDPLPIIQMLVPHLNQEPTGYQTYLRDLWEVFGTEDERQTLLWVCFQELTDENLRNTWWLHFLTSALVHAGSFIAEETLNFVGLRSHVTPLKAAHPLLQSLSSHPEPLVRFLTSTYLVQEELVEELPIQFLELFKEVPEAYQLEVVPLIVDRLPQTVEFVKKILGEKPEDVQQLRTYTAFFTQTMDQWEMLFESVEEALAKAETFDNAFLHECLILELVRPEHVNHPWVGELVRHYRDHSNPNYPLQLFEYAGEFVGQWRSEVRELLLTWVRSDDLVKRKQILELMSDRWWDEAALATLLHDPDSSVVMAALEVLLPLFRHVSEDLQDQVLRVVVGNESHQNYLGYLMGYNHSHPLFEELIPKLLINGETGGGKVLKPPLPALVTGLGTQWNDLTTEVRSIINNRHETWPDMLVSSLRTGLESYLGVLDEQGKHLLQEIGQTADYLSLDTIMIDDG